MECTGANQHQWEHCVLSESGMCNGDLQPPLVLSVQVGVSCPYRVHFTADTQPVVLREGVCDV